MKKETYDMTNEMNIESVEEIGVKKFRCLVRFKQYVGNRKKLNHYFPSKKAYLTLTYNNNNVAKVSDIVLVKE